MSPVPVRGAVALLAATALTAMANPGRSPVYRAPIPSDAIEGSYIVVLDPTYVDEYVKRRLTKYAVRRRRRQVDITVPVEEIIAEEINVGAVALALTDEELEEVRNDETVLYIQQDMVVRLRESLDEFQSAVSIGNGYSWALDRIDQEDLPLDKEPFTRGREVDASGVDVYIVDTGIFIEHQALGDRASYYHVDQLLEGYTTNNASDQNGHGTHCAGIVTDDTVGVTNAKVKAVKVFGPKGTGTLRAVYYGLASILDRPDKSRPAVASLSLGLPRKVQLLNDMVSRLIDDGVTVVVASGNGGVDACTTSPGSSDLAITVGSEYICTRGECGKGTDTVSPSSNYGSCVDILAPGMFIVSSYIGGPDSYAEASGTSQAAPFVSAAAAVYLAKFPDATPQEVKNAILTMSAKYKVLPSAVEDGTPNRIVQINFPERIPLNPTRELSQMIRPTFVLKLATMTSRVSLQPMTTSVGQEVALISGESTAAPKSTESAEPLSSVKFVWRTDNDYLAGVLGAQAGAFNSNRPASGAPISWEIQSDGVTTLPIRNRILVSESTGQRAEKPRASSSVVQNEEAQPTVEAGQS